MISPSWLDSQCLELIFQDFLLNHPYKDWGWNPSSLSWRQEWCLFSPRHKEPLLVVTTRIEIITSKLHGLTPGLLVATPWTQPCHLFKCFPACFSSLTYSFPSISGTWDCWKLVLPVKTRGWVRFRGHTFPLQCSFRVQGAWTASSCKSKLLILNDKSIGVSQEWFLGGWPSVLAFILGRFFAVGGTSCVLMLVTQVSFTQHLSLKFSPCCLEGFDLETCVSCQLIFLATIFFS